MKIGKIVVVLLLAVMGMVSATNTYAYGRGCRGYGRGPACHAAYGGYRGGYGYGCGHVTYRGYEHRGMGCYRPYGYRRHW